MKIAAPLVSLVLSAACTPPLMPWSDYARLTHPVPYVVRVSGCGGALLYFGSRHTYDPADPELGEIDAAWRDFRPTLALNEGGDFRSRGDRDRDVKSAGEAGLVRYLAAARSVRVATLEPSAAAEVALLRERHFTDEQIKTFYVLRQVAELPERGKVDAYAAKMLDSFAHTHALPGAPALLAELDAGARRLLPTLADWRQIDKEWLDPFPDHPHAYTNAVANVLSSFRDEAMLKTIASALAAHERVLAVAGASHVVRQEQRLRAIVTRGCR
jgi:hypothetical protein